MTGRFEGGWRYDDQRGGSEIGDRYLLEFWIGVGPGERILSPILMTVVEPGERLSCSMGRRLPLNWILRRRPVFLKGE